MTRRGADGVTSDAVVAVVLLALGVAYAGQALREGLGTLADTGAGFFPFVVGVVLVVASAATLVAERRGTGGETALQEDDEDFAGAVDWRRIVGVLVAALLIPLIGDTVGFVTTLSVVLVVIAKIMGLPGWRNPIVLGLAFGAAIWLIFVQWLYVPLPAGTLGLV